MFSQEEAVKLVIVFYGMPDCVIIGQYHYKFGAVQYSTHPASSKTPPICAESTFTLTEGILQLPSPEVQSDHS